MEWHKQLHWRIIVGLILGLVYGLASVKMGLGEFTTDWINPWGVIFMNLLKLIAVPLVLASLIVGVSSLSDIKKLSRIGGKTIGIYIGTTFVALVIGVTVANVLAPGKRMPESMKQQLQEAYQGSVGDKEERAAEAKQRGPLQPLVDMVPSNILSSAANNRAMLQIVFFALLFGVALIQVSPEKADPVIKIFEGLNEVVIRMVDLIMLIAPIGVFSLIAKTVTTFSSGGPTQVFSLISALGFYCLCVLIGLGIHTFLVLPGLLKLFTKVNVSQFFKAIAPAQLLAFSTSSSGATLPLTMERCEENVGISEEVTSFVLPLGATINMDGTGLYQAVAAIFISQAMNIDLSLTAQVSLVVTALLASIGTAAVPGAGIIMLVVILESVGVPSSGVALILGVDRILDMLRTTTNVTGDMVVATVVANSEGQLGEINLDPSKDRIRIKRA